MIIDNDTYVGHIIHEGHIFEIFGRAVFEVTEVAEVKRPRNQKQ